MNEVLGLEVGHARGYLRGYVHEDGGTELLPARVTQVVEQVTLTHELCDDVEWGLPRTHTCGYGKKEKRVPSVLHCFYMSTEEVITAVLNHFSIREGMVQGNIIQWKKTKFFSADRNVNIAIL